MTLSAFLAVWLVGMLATILLAPWERITQLLARVVIAVGARWTRR